MIFGPPLPPPRVVVSIQEARDRRAAMLEYEVLLGKIERLEQRMTDLERIDAMLAQLDGDS